MVLRIEAVAEYIELVRGTVGTDHKARLGAACGKILRSFPGSEANRVFARVADLNVPANNARPAVEIAQLIVSNRVCRD